MMFIADFHIHSKYSRATSKECVPEILESWARRKGIGMIGTGDFTHPAWRAELKEKLVPSGDGLYALKNDFSRDDPIGGENFKPRFIISGEISSIYKKKGRVRKVHNLILLPGLDQAESISRRLEAIGNVHSDGRPILGLDSRDLLEIVLDLCPEAIFIPAHIWTPHFSLYGAYSGFDDIRDCFEDLTGNIFALETGLSSDPPMNWRLSALDDFTLVSNSDAHSPANLGREANIFHTDPAYGSLLKALKNRRTKEFYGTIEFYPEEGKYHYDGHRACQVCWTPAETKAGGGICPVCGGRITVGVLHRVEALADREEGFVPPGARHFERLIPLAEVIASAIGVTPASRKVRERYDHLIGSLGPELFILREASLTDIESAAGSLIAEGIRRLRSGQVEIRPGFDGEYGKIKIMDQAERERLSGQLCFIPDQSAYVKKNPPDNIGINQVSPGPAEAGDLPENYFPQGSTLPYELNEEQWEAVSSSARATAVIAGPGTGKTKTLVARIAYLVEQCGVPPEQITAVTFTNKAAREMRIRLEKHFGDKGKAGAMTIGTFHSICLQSLSPVNGKDRIAVIDQDQALTLMEELLQEVKGQISPRDALKEISLRKNGSLPGEKEKKPALGEDLYHRYCAILERYHVLDYDDILLAALDRVQEKKPDSHLLVDEFQDINEIQYRLIREWSRESRSIFIIGDPDQSIYGFRGSDFRYFGKFQEDYPQLRQFRLTRNYRSTPEIINAAGRLISGNAAGETPRLLKANRGSGVPVRQVTIRDEFSEALFVAKEINRMVGGIDMLDAQALSGPKKKRRPAHQARGFLDIAVLYRTNRQGAMLEQCLAKEGIPYVVAGRDEFLSDAPVRASLAFFKYLLNPGDMVSLLICLKEEMKSAPGLRGELVDRYAAGEKSVSSLVRIIEEAPLPDRAGALPEMLRKYAPLICQENPGAVISSWIEDRNLSGLRSMELLFYTSVMYHDMPSFLQNLVLGRESDVVRSGSKVYASDAVSLMTMHGAKGLEFPVVFICGVNDGLIPFRKSGPDLLDEERRLFYVGMTRAKDELILLTSGSASPFLADLSGAQVREEKAFTEKRAPQGKQISLFDLV